MGYKTDDSMCHQSMRPANGKSRFIMIDLNTIFDLITAHAPISAQSSIL